ncbi:MAG: hypothetical protein LC745_05600, partial [Planctomycetia bacterium]|nr:hypothetical protein [Planctomycetia bacterium]
MKSSRLLRIVGLMLGTGLATAGGTGAWAGPTLEFDVPGYAGQTVPTGINDSGLIVGTLAPTFASVFNAQTYLKLDVQAGDVGFVGSVGNFTTFSAPGASGTFASGVNNAGEVVGTYQVGAGASAVTHGFTYQNGAFTTIDAPGATSTAVGGVNNLGQLVGNYTNAQGTFGFVDTNGVFQTIPAPPAPTTTFVNGQVVGTPGFLSP